MLRKVAKDRFPHMADKLVDTEHLEFVWKDQLHLRLADAVAKGGRPKKDSWKLPPMAAVARVVQSIGESGMGWLFGQLNPREYRPKAVRRTAA